MDTGAGAAIAALASGTVEGGASGAAVAPGACGGGATAAEGALAWGAAVRAFLAGASVMLAVRSGRAPRCKTYSVSQNATHTFVAGLVYFWPGLVYFWGGLGSAPLVMVWVLL